MGEKDARGCVQTEEWRMRAMVVLLADRFSTTHHGKTVEDERFPFFPSSFLFFFFVLLGGTANDESSNKGTRRGG